MTDLGFTRPPEPQANALTAPMPPAGPEFPSLRFNGEQAEKAGLTKCAHGDEYEITLKIRATKIGGDKYETREGGGKPPVEFEVIAADEPKLVESEAEEPDDSAEEKDAETEKAPPRKPKQRVVGPKELGLDMETELED